MPAFLENFFLAMLAVRPKVDWSICHCEKNQKVFIIENIYICIWTGLKSKANVEESAFCLWPFGIISTGFNKKVD